MKEGLQDVANKGAAKNASKVIREPPATVTEEYKERGGKGGNLNINEQNGNRRNSRERSQNK